MLLQQILNGIVIGSVYGMFALGFTLLFGVNHIMNMAFGAVFMWGAFAGLYAVTHLGLPFVLALVLGGVAGGLLSVALDWTAFRPLRKRQAHEFSALVSSFGASLILIAIAQQVSNTAVLKFPFGTFPVVIYRFSGLRLQLLQIIIVGVVLLMVAGLFYYLYRTSFGRQVRTVAYSEQTAKLLGINPTAVNFQVFFISGALAGIAGVLIGLAFNSIHFMMGEPFLLRAFVIIILAGLGNIPGALIAGIIIGIVQTLAVAYISSGVADAIVFGILFLVLLVRPTGLFSSIGSSVRVARQ
jgi:branched-chain amino acid transport system permease protein